MKKIVHNYDSLFEGDINHIVKRAKLIVINEKSQMVLCHSKGEYYFLGGHVENDESDYECLKRELKEEAGYNLETKLEEPFISIIYYNKDYPEKNVNTKTITNYYVLNLNFEVNLDNTNLTEDEKKGNFEIKYINKNEVLKTLTESLEKSSNRVVTSDTLKVCKVYLNKNIVEMKLADKPFQAIKSGMKKVEMRLYDEKRKQINLGDQIVFTNIDNNEKIMVNVKALYLYSSFEELYKHHDKNSLGYSEFENANFEDMGKYYSKEEQMKYGVIGIEIEK